MYLVLILCCAIVTGVWGDASFDYTDECYLNPCTHGQCVDGDQTYTCNCDPGYSGMRCCHDINECETHQCINGTCADAVNGYTCTCDVGFEGTYCDQNIDDCENNTCINSTCVDKVNGYTCVCPENYTESCDWRTFDLTEDYLEVGASSYAWGGRPDYALNGIKNGLHNTEPCHHSGSESDPWWEVTLKEPYNIRRLDITNRLESHSRRFRDITIYVGDEVCATYPGPAGWEQLTIEIRCTREDLFGQTVRIVKDGATLTLCEVEIYMY